jgi:hypothetical protein
MFEWAKPVIKPIQDAVGFLESIASVFTKTQPEDPAIRNSRDVTKQHFEDVKLLTRRW